eukprot:jgi/Psemu1/29804/gm1.29804_g
MPTRRGSVFQQQQQQQQQQPDGFCPRIPVWATTKPRARARGPPGKREIPDTLGRKQRRWLCSDTNSPSSPHHQRHGSLVDVQVVPRGVRVIPELIRLAGLKRNHKLPGIPESQMSLNDKERAMSNEQQQNQGEKLVGNGPSTKSKRPCMSGFPDAAVPRYGASPTCAVNIPSEVNKFESKRANSSSPSSSSKTLI